MDKIIKTISESGAFRAFVLDSTETVRTAQEKHQTQASSTVALGRTLIASQILAANEKGNTKLTVKVLGSSSLGAIITVADTKGNVKGYVQNPGVDIKKTATGEVLVGTFCRKWSISRYHRLRYWKSLQLHDSPSSLEKSVKTLPFT